MTASSRPHSTSLLAGASLRVLVADDQPSNQMVLRAILARAGCTVTIAEDGREAVEAWRKGGFDIIVMDLRMPEMDGLEAVRAIRAHEHEGSLARVPILLCTADSEHVAEAEAAGADGYVTKPITPRGLIEKIAAALAGSGAARAGP